MNAGDILEYIFVFAILGFCVVVSGYVLWWEFFAPRYAKLRYVLIRRRYRRMRSLRRRQKIFANRDTGGFEEFNRLVSLNRHFTEAELAELARMRGLNPQMRAATDPRTPPESMWYLIEHEDPRGLVANALRENPSTPDELRVYLELLPPRTYYPNW